MSSEEGTHLSVSWLETSDSFNFMVSDIYYDDGLVIVLIRLNHPKGDQVFTAWQLDVVMNCIPMSSFHYDIRIINARLAT